MKKTFAITLSAFLILVSIGSVTLAQDDARVIWQVTHFDVTVNLQQAGRALDAVAVLTATNVGRGSGSTFTFRINTNAAIQAVTVGGANANFRVVPETRGNLQRVTVTLPSTAGPDATANVNIRYTLPVESNTGLAAVSPVASQFLPLSFWYPAPNTPFTVRGGDTAPFRLTVNGAAAVSSGNEKASAGGSSQFEQPLNGQPFFVQGEWDRIDGAGEAKAITAFVGRGAAAEDRKQAENIIALAAAARNFYSGMFGPAPDVPIRLVSVRRGSGFGDGGTVLLESGAFRRAKVDSSTALLVAETVSRMWIGGQTAVRGEGSGVIRDGLPRFLATLFLEKQFGREALETELLRQRIAYSAVVKRDAPLLRTTPQDDTYFSSMPNKGSMLFRLIEQRIGRDALMSTLRTLLEARRHDPNGLSLAQLRAALVERGGDGLKVLLDQQLEQVTDMDLMIGLPQQRGSNWVAALRNLGSIDAHVTVKGTTDKGEQLTIETTIPARNFSDAVFKTTSKLVRVEVDPEKLYPQLDYSNDVAPRVSDVSVALAEATRQFGTQDFVKAEAIAREILVGAPRMQEARIILGRALLGQNKLEEAERIFRSGLEETLPSPGMLAWSNVGLGEISLRRGQTAEAARRFDDTVRADADYASTLTARAGRIKAETGSSSGPPIDESARAFIAQFDQTITGGKKAELETRIVSGELVRFIGGIVGSQPDIWQTRVLRTESLDANTIAADVTIRARQLGQEQSGTAVLILSRVGGNWRLSGIELFEVR
ncbi:MAG TPA: hypothetical protein VMM84_18555 [Pyrinomonadaceae bacterium]|nr:hypothetical protein [Pyrinomonadaceae bacterium]